MFIFIRHGEKSANDDVHLSKQGYVRRNHLGRFFIDQMNKHINVPEVVLAMKQHELDTSNRPYETVVLLAQGIKRPVQSLFSQKETSEAAEYLLSPENLEKDVLVCWEHQELVDIVEKVIHNLSGKGGKLKLNWGANPESKKEDPDDYTSIWVLDHTKNKLFVYNEFDVLYNSRIDYYYVDYKNVKVKPLHTIDLTRSKGYFESAWDFVSQFF